ncbi:MAG TPA: epoxyqueuosine reductase QueH [bacterium]|nr:epoxyqueuosine reductase QueH [bacterium]
MAEEKLLLHSCCAPCSAYIYFLLSEKYDVTLFFYNPNIYPEAEYKQRKEEFLKFCNSNNCKYKISDDTYFNWRQKIIGLENEKEGGKRCEKCFEIRLSETAQIAKKENFNLFTTTMSISPHKNHNVLNEIGKRLAEELKINYLVANFKKNDGFKKACELSKKYNFYRQNYCGCEFSFKKFLK